MFAAGGLARAGLNAPANSAEAHSYSYGAVAMIFLFTATFGATWLTVPWLYPAEIFPLESESPSLPLVCKTLLTTSVQFVPRVTRGVSSVGPSATAGSP